MEERSRNVKAADGPSPNVLEKTHSLSLNVFQNIFLCIPFFKILEMSEVELMILI